MRNLKHKVVVIESLAPLLICFAAVLLATLVLSMIDSFTATEHLMLGYMLPIILVAIYCGSTLAVLTSFASGLAAAYFLLPPKFIFYIDDPVHIAELGFNLVLALTASKVVGALADDIRREVKAERADEVIE
jgi:two-component system, OmpR family, sensor histidine kinase KdpD